MSTQWLCTFMPPSTNALYPTVKGRRMKSKTYKTWIDSAGWELKKARLIHWTVPVFIHITYWGLSSTSDVSNRIKAVEDLLVSHGIIAGDTIAHVHGVTAVIAPYGVRTGFEGFRLELIASNVPQPNS